MSNSINKIGRSALTRLFCSEVVPSATPTFPAEPLNLDAENDVGYMSDYHETLRDVSGRGYLLYGSAFGLKHVEFERDETLFDGVIRCIRENKLSMPHFIIVATWPNATGSSVKHTYTAYRLSQDQEQQILRAAWLYKRRNSQPAFISRLRVFKP